MVRILLLLLFISSLEGFAQEESPFKISKEKDLLLSGTSLMSLGVGYLSVKNISSFSSEELSDLSIDQIPSFDRGAVNHRSELAMNLSDYGQYFSLGLPFTVMLFKSKKQELITQLIMVQQVAFFTRGVTHTVKGIVKRARPYVYREDTDIETKLDPVARRSFFSGHTAITSALSVYTASVVQEYSNNDFLKTASWAGALTLPAVIGYLRVRAGQHFYSDVMVGYLVGGAIGWLIPRLHKTNNNSEVSLSLTPTFSGQMVNFSLKF